MRSFAPVACQATQVTQAGRGAGGVSGDEGQEADSLPDDAQAPAAHDFEENQDEGKGNENRLPE